MELSATKVCIVKTTMVRVAERPDIVIAEDNDKVILLISFTYQGGQFKLLLQQSTVLYLNTFSL